MNRLFVVKKPCVIECTYHEVGNTYMPADHMACTALKELIDHGFLEEKPLVIDSKANIEERLVSMQILCGSLQHYINELIKELNKARDYWEDLQMDVKKVDKWIAPEANGAPLLCMPNIPKPLHGLAPRIIEGQSKWNLMRTKCYMDADYQCQACGKYLGVGKCQAHELYTIDWSQQISRFERCVCLCADCHTLFIHSGRALSMYKRGELPSDRMLKTAKKCFELIYQYNQLHDKELIVYGTFVDWAKDSELGKWLEPMINKYNIKFYGPTKSYEDKKHWGKWRLLYNGKEYEPKYKDAKEWEEAMNGAN